MGAAGSVARAVLTAVAAGSTKTRRAAGMFGAVIAHAVAC